MITFFLQAGTDTLSQAASAVIGEESTVKELSLFDLLMMGGVFMIPIVILFFYTIYIAIERFLFINKKSKTDRQLLNAINAQLSAGNLDMAIATVQREDNAQAQVLKEGLLTVGRPITEIESNMEMVTNIEIGAMEKKMNHLGTIAGIAPTLGFIGTIAGVIKIFYDISQAGDITISVISRGLYEKMICSGSGLIVGLIAYGFYHLLNGKIDGFALEAQKNILAFINIIQRPNGYQEK